MKLHLLIVLLCLPGMLAAATLPEATPHGILVDRVLPLSHLEELNGVPAAPAASMARWRQAVHELRRSAERDLGWPTPREVQDHSLAKSSATDIPLALVHAMYDKVAPDGAIRSARIFALGAIRDELYYGANVNFALDPGLVISHQTGPLNQWTFDADDGEGPRKFNPGAPISVSYDAQGPKTLILTATTTDGVILTARATISVKRLVTPPPTETWALTATEPYDGAFASGQAYVYLAPGHLAVTNPVVVVEGFDLDNSMDWPVLYDLLNQENLLEDLRSAGFDAVVLDFTEATEPIQRNAQVLNALLAQLNATLPDGRSSVVIGASMGGLVGRYALAWLEQNGIDHRVRTYLSFDSPHGGANIPLGVQHWLRFFQGESTDAAFLLARLNTPAARQMLLYHESATSGVVAAPAPERATWSADLAGIGQWPQNPRLVAVANGSGSGQDQGFAPGDQLIRYEYRSLLVDIDGNVWAVPDGGPDQMIFDGGLNLIWPLPDTYETVRVGATWPLDSAPGGSRDSMAQMDATNPTYGDIVALHASHCFIPTVSALALDDGDPFAPIASRPDLMERTPFDVVYWPTENQEHIAITPQNRQWFLDEIESGVADVRAVPTAKVAVLGPAVPNPFNPQTEIRFDLARSGNISVMIYDAAGRRIRTLADDENRRQGRHTLNWNGRDQAGTVQASGLYFAQLRVGQEIHTTKLSLVR